MNAYTNDPRVHVNAWGSTEREVTYTVPAQYVPAQPPDSDLDWSAYTPGDTIEVKYVQDGFTINGWMVFAGNDSHTRLLTTWGCYHCADTALAHVLGDPQ
ncbi:hypothetical protein Ade02nite_20430 [Paractinoplanes deccanensis]|uniref:Uncharacterized protein n=1 Tax=Paractinoplanes deccanensis TaxID=113561 RepID=A0ABQ3Y0C2_9ACTN|nr:hypothetical protein [Actinoplanes deccanensis]GID73402.1 hypothetical protein Ade02nite_20430 [Actinoplanes deccanensis]